MMLNWAETKNHADEIWATFFTDNDQEMTLEWSSGNTQASLQVQVRVNKSNYKWKIGVYILKKYLISFQTKTTQI